VRVRFDESRRGLRVQVASLRRAWQVLPGLLDELSGLGSADDQASHGTRELLSEIAAMAADIEMLMARVSRETINIGIIGRALAGKSTLARSITGLSENVIPSSRFVPTTAAFSEIVNSSGPSSVTAFWRRCTGTSVFLCQCPGRPTNF
jgi:ribosome biogenesis GTPase A